MVVTFFFFFFVFFVIEIHEGESIIYDLLNTIIFQFKLNDIPIFFFL